MISDNILPLLDTELVKAEKMRDSTGKSLSDNL
jgi:hypothetical protein